MNSKIKSKNRTLREIERKFHLSNDDLAKIISSFHDEMKTGLAGKKSDLKMLPAFTDAPSGKEKGTFLALDIGGTNLRVIEASLSGNGSLKVLRSSKTRIPAALMNGSGTALFDFIASHIAKFLHTKKSGKFKLGFTFSFPVKQKSLASGLLITWTKGFTASGVVGKDVTKLLQMALRRTGLGFVEIAALANDTVGTLAACAYSCQSCDVGAIFGTGTNACYLEKLSKIKKFGGAKGRGSMIINIEWGNFSRLTRNEFDIVIDKKSNNPGKQVMEKMISGMYLGELARIAIGKLYDLGEIELEKSSLRRTGGLHTSQLSALETAKGEKYSEIIGKTGLSGIREEDLPAVAAISRAVVTRAAKISAACLAAVIMKMDPQIARKHTIAVDGALYENHPGFSRTLRNSLKNLLGKNSSGVKIRKTADGSGIGVAVIAAANR